MSDQPSTSPACSRWPRWVYASGSEPDVRFSFANERTFLAWIRTSLALLAAGVAIDALDVGLSQTMERALAIILVALGLYCALIAWVRWARAERAIRRGDPLPSVGIGAILTLGVVTVAALVLVSL